MGEDQPIHRNTRLKSEDKENQSKGKYTYRPYVFKNILFFFFHIFIDVGSIETMKKLPEIIFFCIFSRFIYFFFHLFIYRL